MCKKLLSYIDEDVRIDLKKKLRMLSDVCEWVPSFIQGLVGAITG